MPRTIRLGLCVLLLAALPAPARARPSCSRAVVFTLPGVTWADVERVQPPELLEALDSGASGSVAVRTFGPKTSYSSGYATLGAGSRLEGAEDLGFEVLPPGAGPWSRLRVTGLGGMRELAAEAGYDARPGALATRLDEPVSAVGNAELGLQSVAFGPWVLLAAMDEEGVVAGAAATQELLRVDPRAPFGVRTDAGRARRAVARALRSCGLLVVSEGDLVRAEQEALYEAEASAAEARVAEANDAEVSEALLAADRLLGEVRSRLDSSTDLLVVVTPTTPAAEPEAHLGVAIAEGPGFAAGSALESASTRRRDIVTLPDVAPTLLRHFDASRPSSMSGRPWSAVPSSGDRIERAIAIDAESVFVDLATAAIARGFIAFQVVLFAATAVFCVAGARSWAAGSKRRRLIEAAALLVAGFPMTTYLLGVVDGHALGTAGYAALLLAVDAALVGGAWLIGRGTFRSLLLLSAATLGLLVADLVTGARLQMNTVLGYSPIVAGRFAGIGNLAFAVLAAAALTVAALTVHFRRGSSPALVGVAALFSALVIVDGAPPFGSDVGGTIALVPGFGIAFVLLWGRRLDLRVAGLLILAVVAALGLFLAFDLSRPSDERTHLARLFESVDERGAGSLVAAVERKAESNLRLLGRSVWGVSVVPGIALIAGLVAWPRATWGRLGRRLPVLRTGIMAAAWVAALGFALNDSGIGIPSVMLAFFVPFALFTRLHLEDAG